MDDLSFAWILKAEGGYVWHAKDPGGETNLGIAAATLKRAQFDGIVFSPTVKAITKADARIIYSKYYYDPCSADAIYSPVNLIHFDCAVNSGVVAAAKQLQRAYNALGGRQVVVSGRIAPEFIALVNKADSTALAVAYLDERMRFYRSLKIYGTFGRGWTNRLKNLAAHIKITWKPK